MAEVQTKSVFKSKTVIVNLIAVLAMCLSHWGVVIPEDMVAEIGAALPLLNLALRMVTKDSVSLFHANGS